MGLREEKKEQTRQALIKAGLTLFQDRGFDSTTIDDVTARAGVSRRTFFRYFNSKNDLIAPFREERLMRFAASLADDSGPESPLERVKQSLIGLADTYEENTDLHFAIGSIVISHPNLVVQELFVEREWEDLIVAALVGKNPPEAIERQARVASAAIIGVARQALRDWYESRGTMDLRAEGTARLELLFSFLDRVGAAA